jgi:hypothetical protein
MSNYILRTETHPYFHVKENKTKLFLDFGMFSKVLCIRSTVLKKTTFGKCPEYFIEFSNAILSNFQMPFYRI